MHGIFIESGRLNDKRDHVLPLKPESNLKCFLQLLRNSKKVMITSKNQVVIETKVSFVTEIRLSFRGNFKVIFFN